MKSLHFPSEATVIVQNDCDFQIQLELKENKTQSINQVLDLEIGPDQILLQPNSCPQHWKYFKKTVKSKRIYQGATECLTISNSNLNPYTYSLYVVCRDKANKEVLLRIGKSILKGSHSCFGFKITKKFQILQINDSSFKQRVIQIQAQLSNHLQKQKFLELQKKKKLYKNHLPQKLNQAVRNMLTKTDMTKKQFTELSLSVKQVQDEDLRVFCQNANKFSNLQRLNFKNNDITQKGIKYFVNNFDQFSRLKNIFFCNNKIADQGLEILAKNGQKFPLLQQIAFNENKITENGLKSLFDNSVKFPYLIKIALRQNQIGSQSFKNFSVNSACFANLQSIMLTQNNIDCKGFKIFLQGIKKLPNLNQLALEYNKIGDVGIRALFENGTKFPLLKTVNLNGNQVGDLGIKSLTSLNSRFQKLSQFYLEENNIADGGFEFLVQNQGNFINKQFRLYLEKNQRISSEIKKVYPQRKWNLVIKF